MTIEERALEKYPVYIGEYSDSCEEYDVNESDRLTYIEGAIDQKNDDIEKLKSIMNSLFINTRDKAMIIELMLK